MLQRFKTYISELKQDLKYRSDWSKVDFSQLHTFVIFLGNPRSGTTLVRSMIDAHPNAVIANELHVLKYIERGESWDKVAKRICLNAGRFSENPVWTDYSYDISGFDKTKKSLKVIGDKRSAGTVHAISEQMELIQALVKWVPFPIKVIRCVRNPYDVIATRTHRNDLNLDENIERYFFLEQKAEEILQILKPAGVFHMYSEKLISDTEQQVKDLLSFLALPAQQAYISSCKNIVYPSANQSRYKAEWQSEQISRVEEELKKLPHLDFYLKEGKLPF